MLTASPRLAAIDLPQEPLPVWRRLRTMVDNPLKAWPAALYREPLYRSRILGHPTVYVMAPDLVRAVLLDESDGFEKGEVARRALGSALGDSILLADGPRWLWQRRAVAPIFRPERTRDFLPAMIAAAERTRDRWRALPPASEIDLAQEMAHTTFDIIMSSMLSGPGSIDAELMQRSMGGYLEPISWVMALAMIGAPRWLPYPGIFRARRARGNLHRMLEALIAEARKAPDNAGNLLWLLAHAGDPQTGKSMNAVDIRNNLLTFITAGHETTALALTWTFYLLSLHPEVEWRARREIAAMTGEGRLLPEHIDALAYTGQVIQEAMRLYPPAAAIVRAARRDVQIGNEHVSAGTTVYIPVYAIHRHEALWQEPNRFDPARFEPQAAKARDRYAYLPFGAGPRVCIGASFAQREAIAILATLLSAFQLRLRPGHHPEPRLRVTLRPAGGMPMRIIASS